jgi:hypothetical protein
MARRPESGAVTRDATAVAHACNGSPSTPTHALRKAGPGRVGFIARSRRLFASVGPSGGAALDGGHHASAPHGVATASR